MESRTPEGPLVSWGCRAENYPRGCGTPEGKPLTEREALEQMERTRAIVSGWQFLIGVGTPEGKPSACVSP
jgi:hypothetical protein